VFTTKDGWEIEIIQIPFVEFDWCISHPLNWESSLGNCKTRRELNRVLTGELSKLRNNSLSSNMV